MGLPNHSPQRHPVMIFLERKQSGVTVWAILRQSAPEDAQLTRNKPRHNLKLVARALGLSPHATITTVKGTQYHLCSSPSFLNKIAEF